MAEIMKGVILAGGTGSRLMPLTKVTNKHLLPVGHVPMIWYPIWKLVEAGIHEILIVTGTEHMGDVVGCLGSGKDFGCRFTYKVQDEAGGIAQALGLAENFAGSSPLCVILGDNIFQDSLKPQVEAFWREGLGARVDWFSATSALGCSSLSFRKGRGFWGRPSSRSSKWRWGPVALPVRPTSAIFWPRRTISPSLTRLRLWWA